MAQQQTLRRSSMELSPASAAAGFYQNGISFSPSYNQNPLSLLLNGQDPSTVPASNGLLEQPFGVAGCKPLLAGMNGYDNIPLDVEEPGPLPCLPRAGRMPGGYSNAALLMQQQQLQQLQQCGYVSSGAPGPGGGRQPRPRRHSVTIGMLNEHQQQQAFLAASNGGQLAPGWPGAAAASSNAPRMPLLQQQQQSPNKQLQGLNMQAAAAAAQLGMNKANLGQPFMGGGVPMPPPMGQGQPGLGGAGMGGGGGVLGGLELPPAYAVNGPRLPGAGSSRRHSWAPMGAEGSMAYARWLLQQQQQARANGNLTAQLGDAGALFVNQQQQDQLGLGALGLGRNGYEGAGSALNGHTPNLMGGPDSDPTASFQAMQGQMSLGQPAPPLPLYGGALAKEQLAQHLQQQLQQLQLQGYSGRITGSGQALDPYAEPFVSQTGLGPSVGGLAGGLSGMDLNPYATALHQELQQQQQVLALQFAEEAGLSPAAAAAAASMYAPLQVNGISVDTQLLVSPYADNWDVLGQSANGSLSASGGSAVSSGNGASALSMGAAGPASLAGLGLAAKAKGLPLGQHGAAASRSNNSAAHSSSSGATAAPVGSNSKGGVAGSAAAVPAAAAVAAASMLASLPPLSKVCSDVPWDLKKAADEDAKVLAAQQVQVHKLADVLERSKTLQTVHAAEDAAAEAEATACAAAAAARGPGSDQSGADGSQALFGYRLPDSGDDTWGVSCLPTEAGGNCISQEPSNKLFVGNIGWWVTEEDLLHWFSRFGTVINVKIMYNSRKMHKPKDKWRSREYGFIDYSSPEEAAKAIVWMDGVELPDLMKDTCGIIVQYAKPTGSQESTGNGAGG